MTPNSQKTHLNRIGTHGPDANNCVVCGTSTSKPQTRQVQITHSHSGIWYLGIDPGLSGAMAFYRPASKATQAAWIKNPLALRDLEAPLLRIFDFHADEAAVAKHLRGMNLQVTLQNLKSQILTHGLPQIALLESPNSLPSDGHVGAFKFGKVCGQIEAILAALEIPTVPIQPAVWKSLLNLSTSKDLSRAWAEKAFYGVHTEVNHSYTPIPFKRKKDDGRAEAAALAWLASERFNQQAVQPEDEGEE